ncbi:MAG: hypothetical protein NT105_11065 [Verrucomicrobia bacterium]|nr:hypothetical protein [Verrucomicrobiota bacterium]
MKTIRLDAGFKLDDKNSRWGNPSYQLEPGDPGYVPDSPQSNNPPKKGKRVKRNTYYPSRVNDQITWLENFRNKLSGYATALGLTTEQVTAAVGDARWLIYVLQSWLGAARAWSLACTDAATMAQSGDGSALMALPVFTAPTPTTGVVAVNTGALDRIFALAQTIKDSSGYTDSIGSDLGIVGSEQAAPDFTTLAPQFKLTRDANTVIVGWNWGGYAAFLDMIEIQVDRNDSKGWVFLATDTTPGYTDTAPQPSTPVKWKYRAIFRVGDQQVGLWSDEKSITVGG